MGTFTLIPPMSLGNLNKAEKLSLLKRYMKLMPSGSDSESPDEISLLADSGVPVLNISAGQVTRMNGIIDELIDLAKPEFADSVVTLQLAPYIAELRRLNDRYAELAALRDKSRSVRTENVTSKELSSEAQDLLDDMCALANASSLLQPSEEARVFVRDATHLFAQVRTAYKQRSKGTPSGPAEPGTPEPGGGGDSESPDEI